MSELGQQLTPPERQVLAQSRHSAISEPRRRYVPQRISRIMNSGVALKLPMPLRIDQTVDPLRGGNGEADRHQLAGRRRQAMLRRLAMQMRAIGVGDDQAGFGRENFAP